jgi:parallel beta-helix repeat protein
VVSNNRILGGLASYHVSIDNGANWNLIKVNLLDCEGGTNYGINIHGSAYNNVSENIIYNCRVDGVFVWNNVYAGHKCSGNLVSDNEIRSCAIYGIEIYGGGRISAPDNTKVENNQVYGSGESGIYLRNVSSCLVENNNAINNSNHGLVVYFGQNNTVSTNYAYQNSRNGIELYESQTNIIDHNRCIGNGVQGNFYGIWLENSSGNNTIVYNLCTSQYGGILINAGCNYNILRNNNLHGNTNIAFLDNGTGNDFDSSNEL